ncbi:MAG TPA: A24 family peptidase [Pirellulales bacterium]|nr:A24 family peptidase [Pirellulales bacterium]
MNVLLQQPLGYRLAGVFVIGVLLGHLANVAAYALGDNRRRNPWSREHPRDGKSRWLDRLPLAGWFRLRRKATELGTTFWLRALAVEVAMGGLCAVLYWWEIDQWALLPPGIVGTHSKIPPSTITWNILHAVYASNLLLIAFMLAATLIDADERIIPDEITVPGTLLGLATAAAYAWTLMPVGIAIRPPSIQFVEFITLAYPVCAYPHDWPPYLEGRDQLLPLLIALAVYGFWCISLLPWLWRPRRGFDHATRVLIAYAMRSPNAFSVLLMASFGGLGIGVVWWIGGPNWAALLTSLAGLAVGGGMIWMVRIVGALIFRREAMGFGDVTLMAMIGTFLGWQACVIIFFVAPCFGLVIGLSQLVLGRGREIPYGPFLCLATVVVIAGWRWFLHKAINPYLRLFDEQPELLVMLAISMLILLAVVQLAVSLSRRKAVRAENH